MIPFTDLKRDPDLIKNLLERRYGVGVKGTMSAKPVTVYGSNPQAYAWVDKQNKAFHIRITDVTGSEPFKGWGKGKCKGFAGQWKGTAQGGTISEPHYFSGRVYPKGKKCLASFRVSFKKSKGQVIQSMTVTTTEKSIKMQGKKYTRKKGYSSKYSLDTFYLKPTESVDILIGYLNDTASVTGQLRLQRQ